MEAPEVSVILPVFNRPEHLSAAIDSVRFQTFANWELLIVDDGSDDPRTLEIISGSRDPRIRVVRLDHVGSPGVVRNAGLHRASGEYFAFLDSDDLWPVDKLAIQVARLRASPACGWSYGPIECIDEAGTPIADERVRPWIAYENDLVGRLVRMEAQVATATVMLRRELANALGGFDPRLRYAEDYDLWTRAAMQSEAVAIDEVMASIRLYPHGYDPLLAHRCWMMFYDKFARIGPSAAIRRTARKRKSGSALIVATLLAERADGQGEAWRILLRHAWLLMRQPHRWPGVARVVARLLIAAVTPPQRPTLARNRAV